jgi:hypothetical protein
VGNLVDMQRFSVYVVNLMNLVGQGLFYFVAKVEFVLPQADVKGHIVVLSTWESWMAER